MDKDTIAAISTPVGSGGIGIIKISGDKAKHITSLIFRKSKKNEVNYFKESHKLYHGHIIDPDSNQILDEVLVSVMLAPHSYTGEDVIEINVHSGTFILKTILNIIIRKDARLAEPGEFTKRAFLNGRIDLTQAEAIIDIINSNSLKALEIANAQVDGVLRNEIESMLTVLNDIIVKIEAVIDFPDETENINIDEYISVLENSIIIKLNKLISDYNEGHVIREGLKVVIAGRPNVGKSSLMNVLLKKERSIVTSIPGTTRDIIDETIIISGIPAVIFDTAGFHNTVDPVEEIGIQKALEIINNSDIILFMLDVINPFTEDDRTLLEIVKDKELIVVLNKIDLLNENSLIEINKELKCFPIVRVSSLCNTGIDVLKETIKEITTKSVHSDCSCIVPNLRQKTAIENCLKNMKSFLNGIKAGLPYEFISLDIHEAITELSQIVGIKIKLNILDQIFNKFCIGK
ncbi:tRNA modification GTPase [Desulfobacterium sp. N47]|uniref:tRNA modification GTPase MnmE n=1 Tax=uncultured Desulfobacterium sp. TaxID=201089 RepID=E1YHJ6_9BACT|nr:tRNA modification GTPase mnmE [uncultured Desulfobacterium sp.]